MRRDLTGAAGRPIRSGAVALTIAAAVLGAGCGSDDSDGAANGGGDGSADVQQLEFSVDRSGQLEAPASADAGLTEITLDNGGRQPAEVQLVRVEGDQTAAQAAEGVGAAMQGEAMPDWFITAGGVGVTAPGARASVTQTLEPGTYYAFNASDELPDPASVPAIEVAGEPSGAAPPDTSAKVSAFEYGFDAEGLEPGVNEVLFDNAGDQPHHLIAMPIVDGSTIADVKRAFRSESGRPPVDQSREVATAVIEGGDSQVVSLDLEPGKYALLCFISDRQGGPPHIAKGMIGEAEVGP